MEAIRPGTRLVLTQQMKKNTLVDAECINLTGAQPHNGVAWHADTSRIARAAYLLRALEVIACGVDFAALCADLWNQAASLDLDAYRVEFINRSSQPLSNSEHIRPLVDTIEAATGGIPELSAPKMKVVLLATDEQWVLARIIGQRARDYEAHEQKPYRSSSALPVQLARGIINLLPASAQTVLDPCCGSGTLPVEAACLGYQVSCGDQSPKMAWITRRNLEYFGFPPEAVCQDARDWVGRFDTVVTDVPYGLVNNPRTEKEPVVASILHHLPALTSFALVVAHGDLSSVLLEAGFDRVDVFRVGKFTKLVRHIHRAQMG